MPSKKTSNLNHSDTSGQEPVEQITYEQAYRELEAIVAALEADEQSLDAAVSLYERGQALARYCSELLDKAELKVQQVSGDDLIDFDAKS